MSTPPSVSVAAGAVIQLAPSTKAAIIFEFGDANSNGNPDVTVAAYGAVPFSREKGVGRIAKFGPFDAPVEQAQALVSAALSAAPLPPPVKIVVMGMSATLFGILRIAL